MNFEKITIDKFIELFKSDNLYTILARIGAPYEIINDTGKVFTRMIPVIRE
jgi:hypothetical protein